MGPGLSLGQAQWLIAFMRNLPGGPREPTGDEYVQAMRDQRAQAQAQAQAQTQQAGYFDEQGNEYYWNG